MAIPALYARTLANIFGIFEAELRYHRQINVGIETSPVHSTHPRRIIALNYFRNGVISA